MSFEHSKDDQRGYGAHPPITGIHEPKVEAARIALLPVVIRGDRCNRSDVRAERHIEGGADGKEPLGVGRTGWKRSGLSWRGVVDASKSMLGGPLHLGCRRVGIPHGEICQTHESSGCLSTEV